MTNEEVIQNIQRTIELGRYVKQLCRSNKDTLGSAYLIIDMKLINFRNMVGDLQYGHVENEMTQYALYYFDTLSEVYQLEFKEIEKKITEKLSGAIEPFIIA